jgi:hypothetical protein
MEQAQREYFIQRLNEIAREKVQAKAEALFGPTGRPEQPTWGMVFEGIASGEITLKEEKRDYTEPFRCCMACYGSKDSRARSLPCHSCT